MSRLILLCLLAGGAFGLSTAQADHEKVEHGKYHGGGHGKYHGGGYGGYYGAMCHGGGHGKYHGGGYGGYYGAMCQAAAVGPYGRVISNFYAPNCYQAMRQCRIALRVYWPYGRCRFL